MQISYWYFWWGLYCVGSPYHFFSDICRRVYIIKMQVLEREGHLSSPARKQSRPVFLLPSLHQHRRARLSWTLHFLVSSGNKARGMECGVLANIRKHLSTVGVTEHWHSLPRQVVAIPVLVGIRNLGGHGSLRASGCGWLCLSRDWTRWTPEVPPNLRHYGGRFWRGCTYFMLV